MVTLARESRGLTQTELVTRVGVQQSALSKVESGTSVITDDFIALLAKALNYPDSFFSQMDEIYPFGSTTFYHRRLQSVQAGTLRTIEAKVNICRFHVVRLLKATDFDRRCRFRRIDLTEYDDRSRIGHTQRPKVEEIAQLTRAAWNLPSGPVSNLVRSVESSGGIVIRFDFGTAKMFGLSEWNPPVPPLFFLNDNPEITADRDRFTLAHEIGHVLLHAMPNPDMEIEANRFASELLMPARDIRPHFTRPIKLYSVAKLKPFWKVSMAALIEQAHNLAVINDNQHVYLRMQLQRMGYRHREPAELDIPREKPSLLTEVIQAHVNQLGLGYSDIAQMVNMMPSEFKSFYQIDAMQYGGFRLIKQENFS